MEKHVERELCLTRCALCNFLCFLLSPDFFQNHLFGTILSGISSECQTVWIQIVCKSYQQRTTTLVGYKLKYVTFPWAGMFSQQQTKNTDDADSTKSIYMLVIFSTKQENLFLLRIFVVEYQCCTSRTTKFEITDQEVAHFTPTCGPLF